MDISSLGPTFLFFIIHVSQLMAPLHKGSMKLEATFPYSKGFWFCFHMCDTVSTQGPKWVTKSFAKHSPTDFLASVSEARWPIIFLEARLGVLPS